MSLKRKIFAFFTTIILLSTIVEATPHVEPTKILETMRIDLPNDIIISRNNIDGIIEINNILESEFYDVIIKNVQIEPVNAGI